MAPLQLPCTTFKTLFLAACALLAYATWIYLRPVEIIAAHDNSSFSYVLVKTLPFTDKEKINWWFQNENMLK